MRINTIRPRFWPFRSDAPEQAVVRDAGSLIKMWGEAAYDQAAVRSWREDTGLLFTSRPGHWARVRREVGHRLGRLDDEPEADVAVEGVRFSGR